MLGLRSLASTLHTSKLASSSCLTFYSTISGLARKNWGVVGPAPRSLLETHDDDRPLTHPKPSRSAALKSQTERKPTPPHQFRAHQKAMKKKFPGGWMPPRRLSREAMDGLRSLHVHRPDIFTTPVLAEKFKISYEAVTRILRSKWVPSEARREKLLAREREAREKWIMKNRLEERQRQMELGRKAAGADPDDKLSLQ